MRNLFYLMCLLATFISSPLLAQDKPIFTKGEKSPNVHHFGNVWLTELNPSDSIFSYGTSVAIFDPNARLDWHIHPGGQILIITDGIGYYQEKGKPKKTVKKGEVVRCLPGVEHWHGAAQKTGVTYIATSPAEKGKTIWLKKVTDEEYDGGK
ncbi:cupin domain-containing protein [Pedobacter metabolipauper]|uniref:Cupin domain-containing protein n=1 Tax=Pedobacter metabolipauper TaxID=425513 RepID=A0A4R6STC8_9SPHI|nr:cupin domain-containing protein [Pedobacter metabolipauper]TDQ08695.1 Cupin domain-containing protein [Pedobacter metabolipauper]